jgi:hypothetical protein
VVRLTKCGLKQVHANDTAGQLLERIFKSQSPVCEKRLDLRYIGGELADLVHDMRAWFDSNQIEPGQFQHSQAPPGLAFRVAFRNPAFAAAFSKAFKGRVACAPTEGSARRTSPPSSTEGDDQRAPRPRPDRSNSCQTELLLLINASFA